MDMCDYHNDCKDGDDEDNEICGEETFKSVASEPIQTNFLSTAQMDEMGSQYRCNFSNSACDWTPSGKMQWMLMRVS